MNLYGCEIVERDGDNILLKVIYNEKHPLFKGHFPSKPVVPGVMLMQTVKECAENIFGLTTVIVSGDLKFTNPVIPGDENGIFIEIKHTLNDNGTHKLKTTGFSGDIKYFKVNVILKDA